MHKFTIESSPCFLGGILVLEEKRADRRNRESLNPSFAVDIHF